jgi:hypothetical protein
MTYISLAANRRHLTSTIPLSTRRRTASGIAGACLMLALAAGFAPAAAAGAVGPSSHAEERPRAQSLAAVDVQGKVARADLIDRLQSTMGGAFAGAWFDAATAQLHVGVTSTSAGRAVDQLVAEAGLAGHVTTTSVRSTSAELFALQKRWNGKLASLFAREAVTTAIEPQRNGVSVTLASSVSSAERAALGHEAATAAVNVFVNISPRPRIELIPLAKTACKEWVTLKAYCDRSITSGVTILTEKKPECTAGPLAINGKKERAMLTAGHCIGKAAEKWSAINTAEAESVIGPVEEFVNGIEGVKSGDFADILIEAGWQTGKPNIPVFAVTAQWKKKEKRSYPVKGIRTPTVGNESCHAGETSGESCGQVLAVNRTVTKNGKKVEGFVELNEPKEPKEQLIGEPGDSGGPVMFIEKNNEALMEGLLTSALTPECVEVAVEMTGRQFFKSKLECEELAFPEQPTNKGKWQRKLVLISYPLRKIAGGPQGSLDQLKAELLTTANEALAPAIKSLAEETFPVTFTVTSGESKVETVGKSAIVCTADTGSGEFENGASGTITVDFTGCKKEKVTCSSENAKGEKDPKETILEVNAQLSVVNLLNSKKELDGGVVQTLTEPMKVSCGGVKVELRGSVLGLVTPINKEIATTETAKVEFKQKEGKQEAGECKEPTEVCEKLKKEPFEAKIAEKFEGGGAQSTETTSFSKMVELAA